MTDAGWAEKGSIFDMASKIVEKDLKTLRDFLTKKPRWAEKVARKAAHSIQPVDFGSSEGIEVFAATLKAEHARAIRMVKAEINAVKRDRHNYSVTTRVEMVKRLEGLLAALQRGRGGKG